MVNRERMRLMKNEKRLETERNILKEMDSPFICKYYGIQHDEHSYYMLMEMLQGGELKSLVYPRGETGSFVHFVIYQLNSSMFMFMCLSCNIEWLKHIHILKNNQVSHKHFILL